MDHSLGLNRGLLAGEGANLQSGLRRAIIAAITARRLQPNQQIPPSRVLAQQLGIARNTVTAVYEDLATRGFLRSVERQGYFVAGEEAIEALEAPGTNLGGAQPLDWSARLATRVSEWRHITKPADWQSYRYPFVYGQVDPEFFPLAAWRSASRDALGRAAVNWWAADNTDEDDPLLIEQIRRHILPRRGILARPGEVLITLGAQQGLYLLSRLLVRSGDVVGVESPGYTDARHIFSLSAGEVRDLPVDSGGVRVGPAWDGVSAAVVTPSCHCPTGYPLAADRRAWLLDWASRNDGLLIEDDYEGEMVADNSLTALKANDSAGRVIYLGTFSKVIAPGMRLGYMVGPAPLIAEARALRRLMHRSPPLNNQRLTAIFMVEGYYQGLVRQLRGEIQRRRDHAWEGLSRMAPELILPEGSRGSSIWLRCPPQVRGDVLDAAARARGVLFESGDPFFSTPPQDMHLRLGLSTIAYDRIEPGLEALASALEESL
ncbi:MAG: PLP-dependent aminotransferase family protein [Caulobacteraceae bacterium]|nr:PLP-dependent aminotransferase family protein [Caulobacteraceae bacterium]